MSPKNPSSSLFRLLQTAAVVLAAAVQGCGTLKKLQTPPEYLSGDGERQRVDLFSPLPDVARETPANPNSFRPQKTASKAKKKHKKSETPKIAETPKPEFKPEVKPVPPPPAAEKTDLRTAAAVVKAAENYLHCPYRWGGTDKNGIDCSALVMRAYESVGVKTPRVATDQALVGKPVARKDLQPGDVLLFRSSQPGVVGHSGLVVETRGESVKFIHASLMGVRYDYLESPHWSAHFLFARRYLGTDLALGASKGGP